MFTFTHGTGGRVQVSLNNPNPAFVPTLALFRGGVGTAASMSPPDTTLNNLNATRASAFDVTPVAAAHTYSGNTAGMANSYPGSTFTQGAAYGSKVCTPDGGGRDALVMLTVPGTKGIDPPMNVEISSVAAGFDHTIALWDTSPVTAPTAGAMSNDTRAAAFAAPIGVLDDGWVVESATMSSLFPAALSAPSPAPTVANNNNIQDLGNPIGKRIKVTGNTSTAGVVGDYAAATLMCGSSDSANDIIYKLRPTSNTTVRVATNNPTPGFSTALAVFNGAAGDPAKMSDTASSGTTSLCSTGFAYTPSNFTLASVNFTTAPTVALTCAGPIVFDSSTATFTSGWCSGQTQPVPVVLSQSSGPDIVVLPFKSLSVGSTTVIMLVNSSATSSLERPVVFAVSGNVQIDGAIDASGAGTALGHGAGSNWNCGSSKGGNGGTDLYNLVHGGGGGGGFRSAGGDGGQDGLGSGGNNGVKRTNTSLTPLLGGCGAGDGYGSTATPGVGGGAVQISAGGTLTISATGSVKADGSAGVPPSSGGGSGGGSGGAVLLEGQTVTVTGATSVKGGAGGDSSNGTNGGAGSTSTSAGGNGAFGLLSSPGGGGGGGGWGWYVTRTVARSDERNVSRPRSRFRSARSRP